MTELRLKKAIEVGGMTVCRELAFRDLTELDLPLLHKAFQFTDFDDLVLFISRLTSVPTGIVSLIDEDDVVPLLDTLSAHLASQPNHLRL